jgi:N-methylhydantoinase B
MDTTNTTEQVTPEEATTTETAPDAITTEIIRHGLLASAEEMARNLCRHGEMVITVGTQERA